MADRADDAELLAAISQDEAAFEAFYDRYFGRVTAFAAWRCSCAEDVADAVAQTFVYLLSAASRYDPTRAEPAAFVFGIAANVVRDLHRSGARRRALVSKFAGRNLLDRDDTERIEAAAGTGMTATNWTKEGRSRCVPTLATGQSSDSCQRTRRSGSASSRRTTCVVVDLDGIEVCLGRSRKLTTSASRSSRSSC